MEKARRFERLSYQVEMFEIIITCKMPLVQLLLDVIYVFIHFTCRAGGAFYPNFCTYIENNCTHSNCFTGITGDVWNTLAKVLNFSYTIYENDAWGSQENNSGVISWTGMIGKEYCICLI